MTCKIKPQIRTPKGELVESELFEQLTATYTDRDITKSLFNLSRDTNFLAKYDDKLIKNKYGEPTLESYTNLLFELNIIEGKNYAASLITVNQDKLYDTIDQVLPKIEKFNKAGTPMVASYVKEGKYYKIVILPKTLVSNDTIKDLEVGKDVTTTLFNGIYTPLGIKYSSIREYATVKGLGDPLNAKTLLSDTKALLNYANGTTTNITISEGMAYFLIDHISKFGIGERLLNIYMNKLNTVKKILGDSFAMYEDYYKTDMNAIVKEALAKELITFLEGGKLELADAGILFTRVVEGIKGDFASSKNPQFNQTIQNAESILNERPLVYEDSLNPKIERKHSTTSKVLRVRSIISYNKELSDKRQEALTKRFELFKDKAIQKTGYKKEGVAILQKMSVEATLQDFEEGHLALLQDAVGDGKTKEGYIISASKRLDALVVKIAQGETMNPQEILKAATLIRDLRTFIASYRDSIEMMIDLPNLIKKGLVEGPQEWITSAIKIADLASKVKIQLEQVEKDASEIVQDVVVAYLRPFFKHEIVWPSGKNKGKVFTLETVLSNKDKDIGFMDRFLNSAADTDDIAIQIFDQVIKAAGLREYKRIVEIRHKISAMEVKLKSAGITDTKFMYEYTSEGLPTGNLISEEGFSYSKYEDAKNAYIKTLNTQSLGDIEKAEKIKEWEEANSDWKQSKIGTWYQIPKISKYPSNAYKNLNIAQKEYYKEAMSIKEQMDNTLPRGTMSKYKAIQKMNTFGEALLGNAANTGAAIKSAISSPIDALTRREDDTEFGVIALQDFEGNKIERIPIYYTNTIKDTNRLSLDFSSSLLVYSAMTAHYDEMSNIVDLLELGKEVLMKREIAETSYGKQAYQTIKSHITKKTTSRKVSTKGANSMSLQRYEDLLNMNVYGKVKNEQGTIQLGKFNLDIAKGLDAITSITSISVMGGNLFQGLNNMITGAFQMHLEAVAGEYFKMSDVAIGDAKYFSLLGGLLAEAGSEKNTSTLGLIQEKFNVFQNSGDSKYAQFYKNTLTRLFGKGTSPYLMNVLGENWMQTRTLLAYMNAYKLKDKNGVTVKLLDAYERIDIFDKNGNKIDAKLQLKEGITKEDGSAFTSLDEDKITLRVAKINQFMHGIYNDEDKSAIQKYAQGRMIMQFRKWMMPHYNRRFRKTVYDLQLEQFREGYYITSLRIGADLVKSLINAKKYTAVSWANLTPHERGNIKRALTEVGTTIAMALLLGLVLGDYDDYDTWLGRLMMYQLKRWALELNTSIPNPYSLFKDGLTLLNSPAAALNTTEDVFSLFKFWEGFNEIERGRYEGHSTYYKNLFTKAPGFRQVVRLQDLTTEDYLFKVLDK